VTLAAMLSVGKKEIFHKKAKPLQFMRDSDYYLKHVIRDSFIELIIAFEMFQEHSNKLLHNLYTKLSKEETSMINIYTALEKFCDQHQLNYSGMQQVLQTRDEYISYFIDAGLNPFANIGNTILDDLRNNIQAAMTGIASIKQCIYEGFGLRLIEWNAQIRSYVSIVRRVPVSIGRVPLNMKEPPRFIVTYSFTVAESPITKRFQYSISDIYSVLDNFVAVDTNLFT
jgi:hypothetical protein